MLVDLVLEEELLDLLANAERQAVFGARQDHYHRLDVGAERNNRVLFIVLVKHAFGYCIYILHIYFANRFQDPIVPMPFVVRMARVTVTVGDFTGGNAVSARSDVIRRQPAVKVAVPGEGATLPAVL